VASSQWPVGSGNWVSVESMTKKTGCDMKRNAQS
jgi:hypothetical protein